MHLSDEFMAYPPLSSFKARILLQPPSFLLFLSIIFIRTEILIIYHDNQQEIKLLYIIIYFLSLFPSLFFLSRHSIIDPTKVGLFYSNIFTVNFIA